MLLKRLEMQGFKSFADKTVLEFVNGTTAVVGPNGSGKSNISDAIRWVIGETRAKSLRGSSMHDVIFAGTEMRKPLNFAEVSLVLDNSSHIFPLDYDEIVVTRRLFRSGESVYQINRANCLLKNIHELFMDTGLGRDGYSIIGQGSVSQILSTKAEDRRSLFEEAAGVAKYKYRKDDASRKLSHVEENLTRVKDIITELEGQINPLKNQSEKARKYMDMYGEYKTLDINMSLINIEKSSAEEKELAQLYEGTEGELAELKERESETERKINALYDENKRCDEEQSKKNELLRENEARFLTNENEISLAQNNIKNSHAVIGRIDTEIEGIRSRAEQRGIQISELEAEIERKRVLADEILKGFDALTKENNELNSRSELLRNQIEATRAEVLNKQNDAVSMREKTAGIETLRKSYMERCDILNAQIKSYNEGVSNTKAEIAESERLSGEKRQKHKTLSKLADDLRRRADINESDIKNAERSLSDLKAEQSAMHSRKRMLEEMENAYEGYAKSVKLVLQSQELRNLSLYGTLSALIDVKKEYVTAIETALGNSLQNIVVETEDDAKAAIEFLRRENGGRATFLPISSVKGRVMENADGLSQCRGYIGIASELVDCGRRYKDIIANLLGRTVVADTIDSAIAISRKFGYKFRVVTLDGDVANAGGSISGGSVNRRSGFLSRAAQLKSLREDIARTEARINDDEKNLAKRRSELDALNRQISSYIPLLREYEDELIRLENTIAHLKASIETADTLSERETELSGIEEQLKASSDEIAGLLSSVRKAENEAKLAEAKLADLQNEFEEAERVKQEKTQSVMDETIKLAGIENEIKTAEGTIAQIRGENHDAEEEIKEKKAEQERIRVENDRLYSSIREKHARSEELKEASRQLQSQIKAIDARKEEVAKSLVKIQSSNNDLTERLLQLNGELSRITNRRERLEAQRDEILNRLWDEYELTYSEALKIRTEIDDEKESAKRLISLKAKIKALGSVNIDAIEEYKAVRERYEFLTGQCADLEKSKSDLNKLISSMEELMTEHFGSQFEEINKSFGRVFREMFGGGRARLYLSEPDNLLESGIEIEVQLPGKGLQNINLYSGGEKSFIAIALLFSILRVKPTPFCILDEIDAALDDVNVSRFATYLKNYTDNTQFIIITHRRGSMEAANILYGVTMQEKGISKLLSLMIDEVDEELIG